MVMLRCSSSLAASEIKAAEAWEEFRVSVATSPRSWVPFGSVLAHDELQKVAEGSWQPGAPALCPESSPGPKQERADAAGHGNAAPCPVLLGSLRLHVEKTPRAQARAVSLAPLASSLTRLHSKEICLRVLARNPAV